MSGFSQSHLFSRLCSLESTLLRSEERKKHHLPASYHTCEVRCSYANTRLFRKTLLVKGYTSNPENKYFLTCRSPYASCVLQVNLAIMQKQLSEMAIGHPRQSGSSSRQNGFSGGVGALGIMNNRLAETSVDR